MSVILKKIFVGGATGAIISLATLKAFADRSVDDEQQQELTVEDEVVVMAISPDTGGSWQPMVLEWHRNGAIWEAALPAADRYRLDINPAKSGRSVSGYDRPWNDLLVTIVEPGKPSKQISIGRVGSATRTLAGSDGVAMLSVKRVLSPGRMDLNRDGEVDGLDVVAFLDTAEDCPNSRLSGHDHGGSPPVFDPCEAAGCGHIAIDGVSMSLDFDTNGIVDMFDLDLLLNAVANDPE